jgi:hypothetical protein
LQAQQPAVACSSSSSSSSSMCRLRSQASPRAQQKTLHLSMTARPPPVQGVHATAAASTAAPPCTRLCLQGHRWAAGRCQPQPWLSWGRHGPAVMASCWRLVHCSRAQHLGSSWCRAALFHRLAGMMPRTSLCWRRWWWELTAACSCCWLWWARRTAAARPQRNPAQAIRSRRVPVLPVLMQHMAVLWTFAPCVSRMRRVQRASRLVWRLQTLSVRVQPRLLCCRHHQAARHHTAVSTSTLLACQRRQHVAPQVLQMRSRWQLLGRQAAALWMHTIVRHRVHAGSHRPLHRRVRCSKAWLPARDRRSRRSRHSRHNSSSTSRRLQQRPHPSCRGCSQLAADAACSWTAVCLRAWSSCGSSLAGAARLQGTAAACARQEAAAPQLTRQEQSRGQCQVPAQQVQSCPAQQVQRATQAASAGEVLLA